MSADATSWAAYYQRTAGREPRPLYIDALTRFALAGQPTAGLLAVDLGSGDGAEARDLLRHGWRVLAVDAEPAAIEQLRAQTPPEAAPRLETLVSSFEELALPPASLIYAGFSLPFCAPEAFPRLWAALTACLLPGGRLACHLFGDRDGWAARPTMTFHSRSAVEALAAGLAVERLDEFEHAGDSFSGPKCWHYFELIALRPS